MAETFDTVETNSGSGGAKVAGDTFTQDSVSKFVAAGYIVYGAAGGPYERVALTTGLPVQPQTSSTWTAVGAAAHDAAVSGAPLLLGGYASASAPTAVSADGDACRLWTTTAGALNVADGGGSITVDGTVSVSGTVTVGSHAVTNAGTFAVQVDGSALTALQLIDDVVLAEDAAHSSGDKGVMALSVRQDTAAALGGTDGDYQPLVTDSSGRLHVNVGNTVTVGSHAVTNAGTFAVQAAQSGTWNVTNVSGTVSLPTGAATAAKQPALGTAGSASSDVITVQGAASMTALQVADNGGSLTVDAPVGAPVFVRLSDGSSAISTLPVSLASVPSHAVTNAGTFAVQVDGAALTALQLIDDVVFAEDAAHSTGDKGVQVLAVRRDSAASSSGTDGDYGTLNVDSTGRLWCNVSNTLTVASHDVTNAGTFAVQVSSLPASTNTIEVVGDVAHDAAVAGNPLLLGAYASAAAPSDVSGDGDAVRLWALRSGALGVQPTFAGVLAVAGNGAAGTGVQRVTIANDSTGVLATVSTVTTCSTVTTLANGQTAHDSAVSGSPLRVGAKAETALSGITLVADGDATDLHAGVDGVLIVRPHCNLEDVVSERTTNTDGASTAFASGLAAPGSGIRLYVTTVTVCNSSAAFCTVDLRDGSAGSVLWTLPVPATGGVTMSFSPPLKLTANTALAFDASAATTTLTISASGFKSKV